MKTNLSVYVNDKQRARDIARSLGFVVPRGTNAREGSINQLLAGITEGNVLTARIDRLTPAERREIARFFRDLASKNAGFLFHLPEVEEK